MGRKKKDQSPPPAPEQGGDHLRRRGRPIPLWQKALLGVSVLLMLGGGAAWAYSKFTRSDDGPRREAGAGSTATDSPGGNSSLTDSGVSGFGPGIIPGMGEGEPRTPGGTGTAESPEAGGGERAIDVYSPAVFRLGFSFFAGFAMAYALRQFVKVTLLIAGVILLGLFGLQYAGLVQIDWGAIEGKYDSIAAFFREQTASFTKFVSGYLPSATAAAGGAVIGFRKK